MINLMKYLVMEGSYKYDKDSADIMFAANDKLEAIEATKEFGQG